MSDVYWREDTTSSKDIDDGVVWYDLIDPSHPVANNEWRVTFREAGEGWHIIYGRLLDADDELIPRDSISMDELKHHILLKYLLLRGESYEYRETTTQGGSAAHR